MRVVGPQGLAGTPDIARHHFPGGIEDGAGGAIVLLEPDHGGVGVVPLETENIAYLRAAPAIDGLVVVPHHAQVAAAVGQQAGQLVLHRVGILKLIHQHVAKTLLPASQDIFFVAQQMHGEHDQVAEVEGIGEPQPLLVEVVDPHQLLAAKIVPVTLLGQQAAVFEPIDGRGGRTGLEGFLGNTQLLEHIPQQAFLVLVVVNGEIGGIAEHRNFAPQNTHAEGMKCRHPGQFAAAQQLLDALAHLAGRLVGKGHRQNLPGRHTVFADQPGDAMSQSTGFAGTGPGQQQQRSVAVLHSLALHGVELFQKIGHKITCRFRGKTDIYRGERGENHQ